MSSFDKECKGCLSYKLSPQRAAYCSYPFNIPFKNMECPCLNCIVKSMCVVYGHCDMFDKYTDIALTYMRSKK